MSESKKYRKLTDRQHALKNPGMYIGTMDIQSREYHVLSANEKNILTKKLKIVPGFIQIFQEILSNAVDHEQEDPEGLTMIKVNVDQNTGEISVTNNGTGIPIVMHEDENQYIPEMIFGEFKTSSHFGPKKRKAGGKHGFGAKLTNLFSKKFIVETVSSKYTSKYVQIFTENMEKRTIPKITKSSVKDYTKISYIPDFERFGMKDIDKAHFDIIKIRTFEAAAITGKRVTVYFNDVKIPIKEFGDYIALYGGSLPTVTHVCNDDWEIGMMLKENDDGFEQVSFVNGIPTIDGGTHVEYIAKQITNRISELVKKKTKSTKPIRDAYIRNSMKLFVKARIFDPDFPSQNKYILSTEATKFGTTCELPEKIIDKFAKLGIIDRITELMKFKEESELKKQSGKKTNKLRGIPKLEDANDAGTKNSQDCILILTEGDSAKTLAMAGRGSVKNGNNKIGVFPLRGKLKNVRELKKNIAVKNEEVSYIVKILGLEYGKEYTDTKSLRYGKVMIFTDADVDGTHIKGLFINVIAWGWPSLLRIKGFITSLATPIVKAFKRKEALNFYSMADYEKWSKSTQSVGWSIKYYKGLGTSTKEEAKEYFIDYLTKLINYQAINDKDFEALDLAFSKEKADDRKKWVNGYDPTYTIDYSVKNVSLHSFINKDLIHFSTYDNARSIPSMVDGLKPSQRKIIHTCFLLNLISPKEMKVARLAGAVGEKTGYHHGETSLQQAIIKLAQTFVGANNINLLEPNGQFGSRSMGGKDASASRYIFTALTDPSTSIINKLDAPLLEYVDEDGLRAEPYWFVPIIPLILVNGAVGIGTGYSTLVPSFNPRDIIDNLINKINDLPFKDMIPWYRGFRGSIIRRTKTEYICKGSYEIIDAKSIKITEIPIGVWYDNYKEFLEKLEADKVIKGFYGEDIDDIRYFTVEFPTASALTALHKKAKVKNVNMLEDKFKLVNLIKTSNMHLFNEKGIITKYNDPTQIIEQFYSIRLKFYESRREYLLRKLEHEMLILKMKVQFINEVISEDVKIKNIKWEKVEEQLEKRKYLKFSNLDLKKDAGGFELQIDEDEGKGKEDDAKKDYNYLKRMPIYSVTKEEKERLEKLLVEKKQQLEILQKTTAKQLWFSDLQALSAKLETNGIDLTTGTTLEPSELEPDELEPDAEPSDGEGEGEIEGESESETEDE
jgi:DNA topoisomerase-2